jgi:beta-glucosidase
MNNTGFPQDFIFGTSTSCYQIEGGHNADGKGPSIWDAFCAVPGNIRNNENANMACNHYELYKQDIALLKQLGVKAYRFSIAWTRILPDGTGKVNEEGVKFYSDLIDELLKNDIEPWVTLYHWDLPLVLEQEKDGWLNPEMSDIFAEYADVCFSNFGDRVKHWITLNEPWVVAILGYGQGIFAPGRISNSEPYLVGHHLLLAHAKTVHVYRTKYNHQEGKIGISLNCDWREPLTNKPEDKEAAERALLFYVGWFADPIWKGDYPDVMKERLGSRLPQFSNEEKKLLLGSSDFFGLNHYTTMFAADAVDGLVQGSVYGNGGLSEDQDVNLSVDESWNKTTMEWAIVPWGCRKLLEWLTERYDRPDIYLTENGCSQDDKVIDNSIDDSKRIDFVAGYLHEAQKAIENGVSLKGYFYWSLLDNFEWAHGYSKRFGLVHVDFENFIRTPKKSFFWYAGLIK